MADKRLYDEKTGEGWAKVSGKWHYFRDGKILDLPPIPGLRDADQKLKTWGDTTKKKVKKAVEPHVEQVKKGFLLAGEGAQAASKKYVTDPVNKVPGLWKDLGDRTIGSGKFKDGKELSVFELRRQQEKYNRINELESIDIPETEDFYSIGKMAQDQVDANSDWSKTWGIDSSKLPLKQQISFKAAKDESHWITPTDTFTNTTLEKTSAFTAAVSNPANSTTLGGMPPDLTAKTEDNSIVAQVAGNTQTNTPLVQTPSPTWGVDQQAETRAAEVAKADPKVTQWYDLEGEDGGAAAKKMALKKKQSELAAIEAQQVKIDGNKIQTNQAKLPTGVLPESTRSSWLSDFFNNRRGGK